MAGPKPAALPLGYAPMQDCTLDNIAATAGLVSSTLSKKNLRLFALLYGNIVNILSIFMTLV